MYRLLTHWNFTCPLAVLRPMRVRSRRLQTKEVIGTAGICAVGPLLEYLCRADGWGSLRPPQPVFWISGAAAGFGRALLGCGRRPRALFYHVFWTYFSFMISVLCIVCISH